MFSKIVRFSFVMAIIVGLLSTAVGLCALLYGYIRLTRDLPKLERISDYRPRAVSTILSDDGTRIGEIFEERRYPVSFNDIPEIVRNAFLAAEDSNFYNHPGIDVVSIIRAMWINLRSQHTRQGASTITQQVVKSLLLTREKTYERKAKEAILSYRIENALTKDEILEIYLNEIFLGNGAYGVASAAQTHFRKNLDEISIAEAAYLAGLPQKPSQLTNPANRDAAIRRQRYVLRQMLRNNFITREQFQEAAQEELVIHPQDKRTIYAAPYYTSHVIHSVDEIFKKLGRNLTVRDPGGYTIETAVDLNAYNLAERAVKSALHALDKRQGWRGPIKVDEEIANREEKEEEGPEDYVEPAETEELEELEPITVYQATVISVNKRSGAAEVMVRGRKGRLNLKKAQWAHRLLTKTGKVLAVKPEAVLRKGDVIEVSLKPESKKEAKKDKKESKPKEEKKEVLDLVLAQTPKVQGAMVVSNALTGEVKAIIGGYDYRLSQFNRATQGKLQPGSSFKPFIYLASLEELNYTPATIVPDTPISMRAGSGKIWSPQNYDRKYYGPITLRRALELSRNVVSVYLLRRLGVEQGIKSARRLGISTPIPPNMSIALGTPEVHLIEMVRAYGAFAAEGWLADSIVIKRIKDRSGEVIYEKHTNQKQVIEHELAFVMANMMKGVVERGTATRVKKLGVPVAGKTGTTK